MSEELSAVMPRDVEDTALHVLRTACARDVRLATAESCTGGLLASLLTDIEGCSHAFERGFVVYSNEAKCELLHIARAMVEQCGAVSRDVAIAMAEGALRASRADLALSITGFAGPAGDGDEPGLVHFAIACKDRDTRHRECHYGDIGRGAVRIACIRTALDLFGDALKDS